MMRGGGLATTRGIPATRGIADSRSSGGRSRDLHHPEVDVRRPMTSSRVSLLVQSQRRRRANVAPRPRGSGSRSRWCFWPAPTCPRPPSRPVATRRRPFCAKADSCSMGVWPLQHFAGPGDCIARFSLGCSTMAAHPHARVTAAALRGCVEAIRQRQCGNLGLSPFSLVECTFTGSLPEGAACSTTPSARAGTATPSASRPAGGAARRPSSARTASTPRRDVSRVGLACSGGDSLDVVPAPPATLQAGAECFPPGLDLAEGLVCGGSRCHPLASSRTIGVSCDAGCEPWASCDDVTYRCVAQAVASVGERCGYVAARMPPSGAPTGSAAAREVPTLALASRGPPTGRRARSRPRGPSAARRRAASCPRAARATSAPAVSPAPSPVRSVARSRFEHSGGAGAHPGPTSTGGASSRSRTPKRPGASHTRRSCRGTGLMQQ